MNFIRWTWPTWRICSCTMGRCNLFSMARGQRRRACGACVCLCVAGSKRFRAGNCTLNENCGESLNPKWSRSGCRMRAILFFQPFYRFHSFALMKYWAGRHGPSGRTIRKWRDENTPAAAHCITRFAIQKDINVSCNSLSSYIIIESIGERRCSASGFSIGTVSGNRNRSAMRHRFDLLFNAGRYFDKFMFVLFSHPQTKCQENSHVHCANVCDLMAVVAAAKKRPFKPEDGVKSVPERRGKKNSLTHTRTQWLADLRLMLPSTRPGRAKRENNNLRQLISRWRHRFAPYFLRHFNNISNHWLFAETNWIYFRQPSVQTRTPAAKVTPSIPARSQSSTRRTYCSANQF